MDCFASLAMTAMIGSKITLELAELLASSARF